MGEKNKILDSINGISSGRRIANVVCQVKRPRSPAGGDICYQRDFPMVAWEPCVSKCHDLFSLLMTMLHLTWNLNAIYILCERGGGCLLTTSILRKIFNCYYERSSTWRSDGAHHGQPHKKSQPSLATNPFPCCTTFLAGGSLFVRHYVNHAICGAPVHGDCYLICENFEEEAIHEISPS